MRKFFAIFPFFVWGVVLGDNKYESITSGQLAINEKLQSKSEVSKNKGIPEEEVKTVLDSFGLDYVFSKLKDIDKETLVVFNCENVLFSYMDAAFSEANKEIWSDFYKKRDSLDREKNVIIDRSLLFVRKKIIEKRYIQDFKKVKDRAANVIFVYKFDENRTKFSKEFSSDIRNFTEHLLRELEFNVNDSENSKDPEFTDNSDRSVNFRHNLLITNSKNISDDIVKIVDDFSRNNQLKKIIVIHNGSWNVNDLNVPTEKILVNSQIPKSDITRDEIELQQKILLESGEWLDDYLIKDIRGKSDEEIVYELCKRFILNVCPCTEIVEERIFAKISGIIKDENILKNLSEIIDFFQEIYYKLPNILYYANRAYLWDSHYSLGIEDQKAVEMLKEVKRLYFNEYEVKEVPHRVLKRIGCGIHWRDMAKYNYVRNFLRKGKRESEEGDSSRYGLYLKTLDVIFDKLRQDIEPFLDKSKSEFVKILIDHKIENKKIIRVFNISEEKLKNIISEEALKERTIEEKDKKIKKN